MFHVIILPTLGVSMTTVGKITILLFLFLHATIRDSVMTFFLSFILEAQSVCMDAAASRGNQ